LLIFSQYSCAVCLQFKERVVRVSCSGEEQVVAEGLATCVALVPANPPVKPARIPAPMKETLLRLQQQATE
jgi:hypothetical protein